MRSFYWHSASYENSTKMAGAHGYQIRIPANNLNEQQRLHRVVN